MISGRAFLLLVLASAGWIGKAEFYALHYGDYFIGMNCANAKALLLAVFTIGESEKT